MPLSARILFTTVGAVVAGTLFAWAAETPPAAAEAEPVVHDYGIDELVPVINRGLSGGRNFERGQKLFRSVGCTMCHQFAGETGGGIGPDLTGAGGRMGTRELLESILEPSAVVSDLHGTKVVYLLDGSEVDGLIATENETEIGVIQGFAVDPDSGIAKWDSDNITVIKRDKIDGIEESTVSRMPAGMINVLSHDEIADLFAYLVSGGNSASRMFQPKAP